MDSRAKRVLTKAKIKKCSSRRKRKKREKRNLKVERNRSWKN
jgi:hypothetical protein